jgi:hypothetical protein
LVRCFPTEEDSALQQQSRYWLAWSALLIMNLVLIAWLPAIPAQDVPQHLAYARIFIDHDSNATFGQLYELPSTVQGYHLTHYALAGIGGLVGLMAALKLVLSLYCIGMFVGFHALVRSVHGGARATTSTGLLATLFVWSPVMMMGFLPFALAMPALLLTLASLFTWLEHGRRRSLAGTLVGAAITSSIHPAAGAILAGVAVVTLLANRDRRVAAAGAAVVGVVGVVVGLWTKLAGGLGDFGQVSFEGASKRAEGFGLIDELLRVEWSSPTAKIDYGMLTFFGPFRIGGLLLSIVLFGAAAFVLYRLRGPAASRLFGGSRIARRTVAGLAVCVALCPFAVYVPTEISFLDLRLVTLVVIMGAALVDPAWFERGAARAVLVGVAALHMIHFGYHADGFAAEVDDVRAAMDGAETEGMLMPLVFDGSSAHFAHRFAITHHLSMLYTVERGGASTQFWAQYTNHLPIGYRDGREPSHTADWKPQRFVPSHLDDVRYVLVKRPSQADPLAARNIHDNVMERLGDHATLDHCGAKWCLYDVQRRRPLLTKVSSNHPGGISE